MSAAVSQPQDEGADLIGSLHTIGEMVPAYQVVATSGGGAVQIMILESGDLLDYPASSVREDPRA